MKSFIIILFISGITISLQSQKIFAQSESVHQGQTFSDSLIHTKVGKEVFENSPHIDVAKALYGKAAGLNVYQGNGESTTNYSSLSLHGHAPLIVIDGFIRDLNHITPSEIESLVVLKDATSAALYGVRGANGVVLINTKRGRNQKLKITANYQMGVNTQFRSPQFADAYTYANKINEALELDGLTTKYNNIALNAFKNNQYPYIYPNINWWDEIYSKTAFNHRFNMTFNGGNQRFRYYTVIDYMHDEGLIKNLSTDTRYNSKFTDMRLSLRGNIDAKISPTTNFKVGIVGKIAEDNRPNYSENLYTTLYKTPSAAFPIRQEDGIYGGSSIYGENNPYAMVASTGNHRNTYASMLADATLAQKLDIITKGLSGELAVSFDDFGKMFDKSIKTYRYEELIPSFENGSLSTTPHIYGKDSETLDHSQGLMSIYLRFMFQGRLKYHLNLCKHEVDLAAIYDQQSYTASGRNKSTKRQSGIFNATYNYDNRYFLQGVINYSGTSFLPKGKQFHTYPAISASWEIGNENFMKELPFEKMQIYGSYGLSGWDGNLSHELYLQNYVTGNSYYFTNNVAKFGGMVEGTLPVENLTVEKSEKSTVGINISLLKQRLGLNIETFYEKRSDILVTSSSTSGIIGVEVGKLNAGIQKYKGFDASLTWNDKIRYFQYGVTANVSYVNSKIIEDNQAFQEYDYLYHKGNRVGQFYGLEVIGFFHDQIDINNSPKQTFSTVRPGDIKYKDQNGDNIIDEKDRVRMFGSSIPRCYFGINLSASYKKFELYADFQGLTGKTISLLDSPLYQPLVNNGNISTQIVKNEVPWTPQNASEATLPRLTTLDNKNNYQQNSLWLRDGSFLKLRNLTIAYTFKKSQTRFADIKVYLQGTNLFSLDNIGFTDPEQLTANYPSLRTYWMGIKLNF